VTTFVDIDIIKVRRTKEQGRGGWVMVVIMGYREKEGKVEGEVWGVRCG